MENQESTEAEALPNFRARRQKSGQTFYYFDTGKRPRKEVPLGSGYEQAVAKYRCLTGVVDGYKLQPKAFHLYRHFDDAGLLLYVGVSLSAMGRLERHREASPWFWNIAKVEIQRFSTREESLAAERHAIMNEHPLFNLRMAPKMRQQNSMKLRKLGALRSPDQK